MKPGLIHPPEPTSPGLLWPAGPRGIGTTALLVVLILLAACTPPAPPRADDRRARAAVIAHLGTDTVQIAGPLTRPRWPREVKFSPADERAITQHFKAGATGYLVFAPDSHAVAYNPDGSMVELVRVERLIMLRGDQIVGEFVTQ